MSLYRRSL